MSTNTDPRPSIRFRGRNFLALVVAPDPPLDKWYQDLDSWLARAPAFFMGRPVILDLSAVALDKAGIAALVQQLQARNVRVMGIDGAEVEWLGLGIPPSLVGGKGEPAPAVAAEQAHAHAVAPSDGEPSSLVVDGAVRSGQSIYFPRGDVTVVGAVQSGAEIVAGGSITVHGALRGRAIAGASGNDKARIFCRKFEAEFLCIDGYYLDADSLDPRLHGKPVQARLDGGRLITEPMD
ncbi:septum site-determining protein MinC [Alsobacter sp. SYSU M60028]|uniref:Probable septum site-determining protein MinC n=1 Tax=Alsobacter ponti TaxID=2962936 RepID=A0ABT1L6R3_9HYPH|nr:septum site-determining protein MinC [Alsobacter ponti]